jgi:hypothetical protein
MPDSTPKSPRELVERAQLLYGQWKREAALLLMIEASLVTAQRRHANTPPPAALSDFLDQSIHEVSLGSMAPGEALVVPLTLADGEKVAWRLGVWLLHFAAVRTSRSRELPAATDFHADPTPWIRVTPTEVIVPDMLIEGLATAVALAPENAAEFPAQIDDAQPDDAE